ncbi:MAG: hypothetical protein ACE37I_17655 [Rubinisphaera brasiliensis]|uniref:hypothetical protein n=1 Tax=Rubinisphaera brasiliensis TaxID=119 RepID=UPI003918B852
MNRVKCAVLVLAALFVMEGLIQTEADAGRRCRRSRKCYTYTCSPCHTYYYTCNPCYTSCTTSYSCHKPASCCQPVCSDCGETECCNHSGGDSGSQGTARFSIDDDDEPASCCKPKHLPDHDGDHGEHHDHGDHHDSGDEGDGGGTLRSGGKGGTFK